MIDCTWVAILNDGRHLMETTTIRRDEASAWLHQSVRANLSATSIYKFWYMLGTEAQEYIPTEVEEVFFS